MKYEIGDIIKIRSSMFLSTDKIGIIIEDNVCDFGEFYKTIVAGEKVNPYWLDVLEIVEKI